MSIRYKEYQQLNLPGIADEILTGWDNNKVFEKSVELREGSAPFVFYEGPPSANGMPGIHHVISRTLKDLVCRYKTMQGFQVKRKGGWDTHGLPVELGVEKLLGITKEDIGKKISVEEYNATCRREVLKFKDQWDDLTRKMGYWVDLRHPYITFENNYIETLWWCLKELYNKDLLYEDVSIQPYSPAAGTGLSSHELNQPGTYKDVKDTSAVAMFKIVNESIVNSQWYKQINSSDLMTNDIYFLAWTTTPWTLPSNLGLTVGPNIDYVLVKTFNPYTHIAVNVILAKALVNKYFKSEEENGDFNAYKEADKILPWKILSEFKGKELEGINYEQLLPSEANTIEKIREITPGAQPFKVVLGDFVTTEDGTGIVHTAPAFGADDFKAGKKNNLGILTLVDKEGKFVEGVGEFSGRFVKDYRNEKNYADVNVDIAVKLKKENRAFKVEKYEHNYPHCWRTDKPIIYYPLDAWFIRTTAVKDRMFELNKTINWKPASTGTGRFGNWLENMVDWNLSRSRYWGTPLPIWRNEDGEEKCIGSIRELNDEIKKASEELGGDVNKHYLHEGILDLHKPYVDDIILVSDSGQPMKRVTDLVDVWFDSGAMPYAQWGLPDTSSNEFGPLNAENFWQYHKLSEVSPIGGDLEGANFPADFIAEGVDQTRGWFYTLHALGVLLFDSVAYKTVVSNGLVLDKNGNKMSKRLGNAVDPFETLSIFGPDATRWYLITNASPWDSLKFDIEGIKEIQRKFFGTLYNTYQFFALYANVDGFSFKETYIPVDERPEIDRWILSSLNSVIRDAQQNLDNYEPTPAGRAIENFVDEHLSNWYVRLCRRRFWKGEYEHDKICAYQTLYECLETVSGLIAPIAPFFAEWLFGNLNGITKRIKHSSVHHTDFPKPDITIINPSLEKRMQLAQDVSSLILSLRKKVNIKVRQPLQKVLIPAIESDLSENIRSVEEIIKSETNIKEIEILSANNDFIKKKAKANFKTLGKKLGPKMKWAAERILHMNNIEIDKIQEGEYLLNPDFESKKEEAVYISAEDLEISTDEIPGYEVTSKGSLTVALDITITDNLRMEGEAREFVNRIQNIRKDQNLELTDKILVKVAENEAIKGSITQYNAYICAEILADKLEFLSEIQDGTTIEVNDYQLKVNVIKKGE
ncbi:MAG TPA: isoleucine--tRNA ligase [Chitinophagaceae bacterium]|nr:isoleucine--tRNA ligase [Chitinophagaceae bacterium]